MGTELAWAAGFYDGEGSTSVDTKTKSLQLNVGQAERTTLERFAAAVGAGQVYETMRDPGSLYFHWACTSASKQVVVIEKLWPYLSGPKKAQVQRCHAKLEELRSELERQVKEVKEAYVRLEEVMSG